MSKRRTLCDAAANAALDCALPDSVRAWIFAAVVRACDGDEPDTPCPPSAVAVWRIILAEIEDDRAHRAAVSAKRAAVAAARWGNPLTFPADAIASNVCNCIPEKNEKKERDVSPHTPYIEKENKEKESTQNARACAGALDAKNAIACTDAIASKGYAIASGGRTEAPTTFTANTEGDAPMRLSGGAAFNEEDETHDCPLTDTEIHEYAKLKYIPEYVVERWRAWFASIGWKRKANARGRMTKMQAYATLFQFKTSPTNRQASQHCGNTQSKPTNITKHNEQHGEGHYGF